MTSLGKEMGVNTKSYCLSLVDGGRGVRCLLEMLCNYLVCNIHYTPGSRPIGLNYAGAGDG